MFHLHWQSLKVRPKMQSDISKVLLLCALIFIVAFRVALHLDWIQPVSHLVDQNNELFTRLVKLTALLIPLFLLWRRYKYCQRFNLLPGFKTNFGILGSYQVVQATLKRVGNNALGLTEICEACHIFSCEESETNGFFAFWVGPAPVVQLSSPELIRQLHSNYGDLPKSFFYSFLRLGIGDGLVTSVGEKWQYHRKLLTPTFNFKVLESFMPNMKQNVDILINRLAEDAEKNDGVIGDTAKYIFPCALDVLCESSMGLDINAQKDPESKFCNSLHKLVEAFCVVAVTPRLWMTAFPITMMLTSFGREVKPWLTIFQETSGKAIAHQFRSFKKNLPLYSDPNNNTKEPFINTLFREHVQRPKEFPMDCVQDEVNTFMAAGHDTTGWTICYALFMLGHHPEVQAKVHEEVSNFFNSFENEDDITLDSLKELKYTDAVIRETLRLYPTIPLVARHANRDIQVGKFTIPSGTQIVVNMRSLHRNPEYWAEPARFQPERFLDSKMSHPYAFLPFSAGPRNCIGQRYAMVLVKSVLAYILRKFALQSLDPIDSVRTVGGPIAVASCPIRIKLVTRGK